MNKLAYAFCKELLGHIIICGIFSKNPKMKISHIIESGMYEYI